MSAVQPARPGGEKLSRAWVDRWLAACSDLAELERSNPMTDAVIEEIDGRLIRVGDNWLADFASCNYLGFDLEREIIEAIPAYLDRWGTHPSWSRLLGSPVLYEQIEERLAGLLGAEDVLVLPTITLIHFSVIPVLAAGGSVFVDRRAHKTIYEGAELASLRGAKLHRFEHDDADDLERQLRADNSASRLICIDGINSMTGNAPDLAVFADLARKYDAILYVDDAHGFGVIGERSEDELSPFGMRGNSIVRHLDESYDNVVLVAGLSKSYSSLAAFIACPTELKRLLKTAAPPYLYSGPSPVASLATTHRGPRSKRTTRRRDPCRALGEDGPRASRAGRTRHLHAEPLGLPDHRGAACEAGRHRRAGPLPVRTRRLRDACRISARAASGGRVQASSHRREHRRRGRPADRGAREARERVRSAGCGEGRWRELSDVLQAGRGLAVVSRDRFDLDGGVPLRAAVQGVRRPHQPDRADVSDGHRTRHTHAPSEGRSRLEPAPLRPAALRRGRRLHLLVSRLCSAAPSAFRLPAMRSTSSSIQRSLRGSCCSYGAATPAAIGPQSSTR